MPTTHQLLQLLPDAREAAASGRRDVLETVLDEMSADVSWIGRSYRCSPDLREDALGKREIVAKLEWMQVNWWWDNEVREGRAYMAPRSVGGDAYRERARLKRAGMSYYGINRSVAEEKPVGAWSQHAWTAPSDTTRPREWRREYLGQWAGEESDDKTRNRLELPTKLE